MNPDEKKQAGARPPNAEPDTESRVVLKETGLSRWIDGPRPSVMGGSKHRLYADADGRRLWGRLGGWTPEGDPWMRPEDYRRALDEYHAWGMPRMGRILELLCENSDEGHLEWGSVLPDGPDGLSMLRVRGVPTGLGEGKGPSFGYFIVRLDLSGHATVSPRPPVAGLGLPVAQPVAARLWIDPADTDAEVARKISEAVPTTWDFVPDARYPLTRWWPCNEDLNEDLKDDAVAGIDDTSFSPA